MCLLTESSNFRSGRQSHRLILATVTTLFFSLYCNFRCSAAAALFYSCYYGTNYTGNSSFETNLNQVLSRLTDATPSTGYYSTSSGESPDQVHGVALCRGDINADDCKSCLVNGSAEANQLCQRSRDVSVWYDYCFIRYSDEDFAGSNFGKIYYSCAGNHESGDSTLFSERLLSLMQVLIPKAASSNSSSGRMFASDQIGGVTSSEEKIYGMVECRRDLSGVDCVGCLQALFYYVRTTTNCSTMNGARVVHGSCNVRYETYPFAFNVAPSPPSDRKNGGLWERKRTIIMIISAGIVFTLVVAIFCVICLLRKRRKP